MGVSAARLSLSISAVRGMPPAPTRGGRSFDSKSSNGSAIVDCDTLGGPYPSVMDRVDGARLPFALSRSRDAHEGRAGLASGPGRIADSVCQRGTAMPSMTPPDPPPVVDAAAPARAGGRVLLVHYTYTQQALRVSDAMAAAMREEGCEVTQAGIEFTDARYVDRVTRFPMRNAFLDVLRMMPAQVRRRTGEVRVPPEAQRGGYDLVCVFSPTWWLTTCMPIRSFLKLPETGALLAGTAFTDVVVCR